jgi:TBC1 domain family member 6
MDVANGTEEMSGIVKETKDENTNLQRSAISNFHVGARLPVRTSSKSSPVYTIVASTSKAPSVPLSPTGDGVTKTNHSSPVPRTAQRSTSNDTYRASSNSATYIQSLRRKPSETSRLRLKSKTSPTLQADRRYTEEGSPQEDSLHPRRSGLRVSDESSRPPLKPSSTFPLQAHDEAAVRQAFPLASRDRGRSTSSSRSTSAFPSIPLRPSTSIPDYGTAEPVYSRQRNFSYNSSYRPGKGFIDVNNVALHRHDTSIRTNGNDGEEIRASFRSALTSNSSYFAASATERSSVMTKSTSATSIYGHDEGMSVDDAIGMYENGFTDSGAEDECPSRPDTAVSYRSTQFKRPSFGVESLALPHPPNFIIRDSAAMFQVPNEGFDTLDAATPTPGVEFTPRLGHPSAAQYSNGGEDSSRPVAQPSPPPFDETRDRYGFRKKTQHISVAQYDAWNGPYSDYLARRRRKWVALLNDSGLPSESPASFPPRSSKVKRFIRKGIPPDWRGAAWFFYAGGHEIVAKHHGLYDTLLKKSVDRENEELIERDLNRTFPDNIRFKPDLDVPPNPAQNGNHSVIQPETPILRSLRRVLQAFSIYNPRIGYCQSLNYLAGLLLLFMDEEKSFWLLNIITRDYLPGTHEVNLEGVNVDLGVLMNSVKDSMPSIWAKIGGELDGSSAAAGASQVSASMRLPPITLCCSAWFMSCFIGTLPIETTLRVWDSFFYEGSKTLFRISLAIFKVGEAEIRAVNDPMEIFQVVQTIPRRLVDASALMEACFKRRNGFGHLSQETIDARRAERRRGYAEERKRVAAGEDITVQRKHTIFSRRRGKGKEKEGL